MMCTLINVTHAHSTTMNSHKCTGDRWRSRWWKHRKRRSKKSHYQIINMIYVLRVYCTLYIHCGVLVPVLWRMCAVNTIFKHGKITKKIPNQLSLVQQELLWKALCRIEHFKLSVMSYATQSFTSLRIHHIFDHAQKHTLVLNDFIFVVVVVMHWFWDTAIALLYYALNSRLFIFVVVFSLCN